MTVLQNRLTLHRFICREFGYEDLGAMLERLGDAPAGLDGNGESEYAPGAVPEPRPRPACRPTSSPSTTPTSGR